MRTTVTLESGALDQLIKTTGFKSKAKAVSYAIEQTLRLKKIEQLEGLRGKVFFDKNRVQERGLGR